MKLDFFKRGKNSLRNKLIIFMLVLAFIPIGIISMTSLSKISMLGNENNQQLLAASIQSITDQLADAFSCMNSILDTGSSTEAYVFLTNSDQNSRMKQYTMNIFRSFEESLKSNRYANYINDVCLISTDGRALGLRRGIFKIDQDFYSYDMIRTMFAEDGPNYVIAPANPMYSYNTQKESITFSRFISYHGEAYGVISVDVDLNLIGELFSKIQGSAEFALLINGQGEMLAGSDNPVFHSIVENNFQEINNEINNHKAIRVQLNQDKYYLSSKKCGFNNWRVIIMNKSAQIDKPLQQLGNVVEISCCVSLIICVMLSYFISRRYFRPISDLQNLMHDALEHDFEMDVSYSGDYEIVQLYRDFNSLLGQTRNYMRRILIEQENLRKAEMNTLQAQINPHFLYNTLDIAVHVAESGQMEQVINLLIELSRYYRIVLSGGMQNISLEKEIENTETYLWIMKMHYLGMLDYRVNVEGDVGQCPSFPKISIQPLVENAVIHGLNGCENGGMIELNVRVSPKRLLVEVRDNGVGMDETQLNKLKESLQKETEETNDGNSFGLRNVKKRLEMYFGEKCVFQLNSKLHQGTSVMIEVLLNQDGEEVSEDV